MNADFRHLRHALRTPLNHIIGYSEMLIEDATEEGRTDLLADLAEIHSAGQELLQAIQRRGNPAREASRGDGTRSLEQDAAEPMERIRKHASRVAGEDFGHSDIERILAAADTLDGFLRASPMAAPAEQEPEKQRFSGRLLVVDDDETNRDILRRQLERQGYEVETIAGGRAALRRLAESAFDLLLLDILMPEMDGFQVLAELKTSPRLRHVPVIVISALDEMESVVRCIEMGADDFVSKPFDRVILRARIGAVLKRHEAERERAQISERFRLLLESTGEGIFGINRAGECTFINAAAVKMLGYSRDEILGKEIHDLMHHAHVDGSSYPRASCPILRACQAGEASRIGDESFFRSNQEQFPVEYTANPILHAGELQGAVITFSDISERKRNEEKFRDAAKLESLGVLAGGVAHDFNNLLTGILGNASLVLYSPDLIDNDRDKLQQIVKAAESAAELTRQMLAYVGKGRFQIRPVDLAVLVRENEDLLRNLVPGTVHLKLDLPETLATVEADPSQMQQVVMNLVINAGEAIGEPQTGTVSVRAHEAVLNENGLRDANMPEAAPGRYAIFEVKDTGKGMPPEVQARIFEPFFSTKFAGRGLGLAAVQGIVKSHKGNIVVKSAPGRGTTMMVYFPASSGAALPPKVASTKPARQEASRILVVDDEEVIRTTTETVLASAGHHITLASSGQEAISLFKTRSAEFSLVLLDMMMPGMGGDEVLKYLRAIRPDISIIVSSGFAEGQVMKYFAGRRVSGFIQKPYTANKLLEAVGAALNKNTSPLVR